MGRVLGDVVYLLQVLNEELHIVIIRCGVIGTVENRCTAWAISTKG